MNSLITQVNNPFRIQELGNIPAQKNSQPPEPPLEGEYIPPESVDSQPAHTLDIFFRLFTSIDDQRSLPIGQDDSDLQSASRLSAYQEFQKLIVKNEKTTGNYIDLFI